MKDNISLIAAAAGGFMLSVALSGILRGAPVTVWPGHSSIGVANVTDLRIISVTSNEREGW